MSRFPPVVLLLALSAGGCITFKPRSQSPSDEARVVQGVPVRKKESSIKPKNTMKKMSWRFCNGSARCLSIAFKIQSDNR